MLFFSCAGTVPVLPMVVLDEFRGVDLSAQLLDEAVDSLELPGDVDLLRAVGDAEFAADAECGLPLLGHGPVVADEES